MSTKYVARLNGQIVGKRTTKSRAYTHAVVVRVCKKTKIENTHKAWADSKTNRSNFRWYSEVAAQQPGVTWRPTGWNFDYRHGCSAEDIERAMALVEGGYEAYLQRNLQKALAAVEAADYGVSALTWCGRPDLAQKAAASARSGGYYDIVEIVPAEEVA